jgi:hypothetical protein
MRRTLGLLAGVALAYTTMACQGNVFQLKVGECFNGASTGDVSDVTVIACTSPHDAEVYSTFQYPNAPSDYPGSATVKTTAEDGCKTAFAPFVGKSFDESVYGLSYLQPTADSWKTGDRTIDCLITSTDTTQLTGSAKGTNK